MHEFIIVLRFRVRLLHVVICSSEGSCVLWTYAREDGYGISLDGYGISYSVLKVQVIQRCMLSHSCKLACCTFVLLFSHASRANDAARLAQDGPTVYKPIAP